MTIIEARDILKNVLAQTHKKAEIKTYEKFIGVLTDIGQRDFSEDENRSIEAELGKLQLDVAPDNKGKYYRKKLAALTKFLRDKFSLITEGYYTALGVALGPAFGVAMGAALGQLAIGLAIGVAIGITIGASMDKKAKQEGRVLKVKLNL